MHGLSSPEQSDVQFLTSSLKKISPSGVTPLAKHIDEIYDTVSAFEPDLRRNGQRMAVILATDGLPTDDVGVPSAAAREMFENALKRLMSLPVWVVVRLCTNVRYLHSMVCDYFVPIGIYSFLFLYFYPIRTNL